MVEHDPDGSGMGRNDIADRIGMARASGTFSNYLSELVSAGYIQRNGRGIRALYILHSAFYERASLQS